MNYVNVLLSAGLIAAAACGPASAQGAPPSRNPAQVEAGTYKIEPNHTRIVFSVSHLGFTEYYGQFNGASGVLELDPASPVQSKVTVSIPAVSVDTSNSVLNAELRGVQWFDAAQFPSITFTTTKVVQTSGGAADLTGDLTFHGVTRAMTLHASFNAAGVNPLNKRYTVGFNAVGQIKRSDFGQTTYLPLIGDDVTLMISAAFEKANSQ